MRLASLSVAWSPESAAAFRRPLAQAAVLSTRDVLPAPGPLIRLSARTPRAARRSLTSAASSSFLDRTFSWYAIRAISPPRYFGYAASRPDGVEGTPRGRFCRSGEEPPPFPTDRNAGRRSWGLPIPTRAASRPARSLPPWREIRTPRHPDSVPTMDHARARWQAGVWAPPRALFREPTRKETRPR